MASSHARDSRDPAWVGANRRPRSERSTGRRLVCLLTTLHPERALSNALVQHLSHELPDMHFTLETQTPDVVWVCGFESGAEDLVEALRARFPDTFLVVTGRGPIENWGDRVRAAGADYGCGWPLPIEELKRILHPSRHETSPGR